jgi:hypothetical protein
MAREKKWRSIAPRNFTSNGSPNGVIQLASTRYFKVKQAVIVKSSTQPDLFLEVKDVLNQTTLVVGAKGSNMKNFADLSAYLVADSASIEAPEQTRPSIPEKEFERAVFEEEPTVAKRVIQVDEWGVPYSAQNPLPINIDGDISIDNLNVELTHLDNFPNPGDVADSVRIGDGTELLAINPDGSINVVSTDTAASSPTIDNIVVVNANNQNSYTFPIGTKRYSIMPRTPARMQVAYNTGETNTNYVTVRPGKSYEELNVSLSSSLTVFFELNKPGVEVEIIYWI